MEKSFRLLDFNAYDICLNESEEDNNSEDGYNNEEKILFDEINAYLATSSKRYLGQIFDIKYDKIETYHKHLTKMFKDIKKGIDINIII